MYPFNTTGNCTQIPKYIQGIYSNPDIVDFQNEHESKFSFIQY
jgi:hypothetical protein